MALFLSGLPVWAAFILLVVLPTIIALCGLIVSRRWFNKEHLTVNNEVAGFKFATVGVIYSVLVAFAVIVVWEKFNEAERVVVQEAGAAAILYRLTAGSDPALVATRAALVNYLKLAIERDWPRMAVEKSSHEVSDALDKLYDAALVLADDRSRHPALLGAIFQQLDAITQARRTRLHLATGIVPPIVWLGITCAAILTIGFTFFFGTTNLRAQVLMTGILSILVFMGLLVIISIDHPFTGPSYVSAEPLQSLAEDFRHEERLPGHQ
jgi:hypothetical protein